MKFSTRILIALTASAALLHGSDLPPNRGTQLFVLIQKPNAQTHIVVMKPSKRRVLQEWNPLTGTYDFVSGVVRRNDDGSVVRFTRYSMTEDYIPRTQRAELVFPYSSQPRYRFFDVGSIVGFYRNSPNDFDAREFLWPHKQAMRSR